jgi:hypothetical protein
MVDYFFDSYAVIEILKGNREYDKYVKKKMVITLFNLAEIYWAVLKDFNEEKADATYNNIKEHVIKISDTILKKAIKFRLKSKRKDLSYADCIGYIYAIENDLVFLTGDKEFKNMENVEFVN